jgi:hypothetical protein
MGGISVDIVLGRKIVKKDFKDSIRPHPEGRHSRRSLRTLGCDAPVSKDGAASWFETRRFATLLTMRPRKASASLRRVGGHALDLVDFACRSLNSVCSSL